MLEKIGEDHFISGMALGIDIYAAESDIRLKDRYPHLHLEAAIPCREQTVRWNQSHKMRYNSILSKCDAITYIGNEYTSKCMMQRNIYMVDKADYLFAVWDGSSGGTGNTVKYALKKQKNNGSIAVLRLDPNLLCLETLGNELDNGQISIV